MAGAFRMRPIRVTDLTMTAGAFALLFDPIFQGLAISLLFAPVGSLNLDRGLSRLHLYRPRDLRETGE